MCLSCKTEYEVVIPRLERCLLVATCSAAQLPRCSGISAMVWLSQELFPKYSVLISFFVIISFCNASNINYGGILWCICIQKLKSEAILAVGVFFVIHVIEGSNLDEQILFPPQCKCIFGNILRRQSVCIRHGSGFYRTCYS